MNLKKAIGIAVAGVGAKCICEFIGATVLYLGVGIGMSIQTDIDPHARSREETLELLKKDAVKTDDLTWKQWYCNAAVKHGYENFRVKIVKK